MVSELPPAANGDTMRTGRVGQSCACAVVHVASAMMHATNARRPHLVIVRPNIGGIISVALRPAKPSGGCAVAGTNAVYTAHVQRNAQRRRGMSALPQAGR